MPTMKIEVNFDKKDIKEFSQSVVDVLKDINLLKSAAQGFLNGLNLACPDEAIPVDDSDILGEEGLQEEDPKGDKN